ncbi:mRNA cap guanine-N7 methyltransferase [Yamadazyma tenuis ATCC 10573]|uniref:mRNA cap guanine-N(7) methyltransferase n=1 Tax=Candida tenuis (strain ATCC 10573 / BCRC 21748 / CBS 615 / JCM 9827 / NBRC 10315 / NRRL Y-1498 / VKM Y-70) TaxID=590646 RepID=G3AWZ4_CANTC|nr:mRNA cap guanine-N7 methyltransferase [Yamadazyma tenuis ATCC 10573]EGV66649.1 mRNA cap guanine-N7 methyltransferase [Yamadazyma tenuis ATCC 10573]
MYKQQAELPAWMKKGQENKYDRYGARPSAPTAPEAESNDKYSKYRVNEDDRANRIRREGTAKRDRDRSEEPEVLAYKNLKVTNPANSYYQTFQSNLKRDEKDVNSIIRTHYNQRTYQSKYQGNRTKSPIIKLRNFNNIIKYILLGEFCKPVAAGEGPFRVLDLCCGKGGDLNKMEFIKVDEYVGIDISDASIREAYSRYEKNKVRFKSNFGGGSHRDSRKYNFQSFFATGDLFNYSIPDILEPNFPGIIDNVFPVDAVSNQFSLHYAFETEDKIRCLINNVAKSLKTGGKFVGTIPSSDFIKYKVKKEMRPEDTTFAFGNELYQVKFHEKPPADGDFNTSPFGNGYNYSLTDAIDDVPEYVVPFETLRRICEDNSLVLKVKKDFIEFFNKEIPKYFKRLNNNLIQSIKRSDGKYGIEGLEREAIEFYLLFVFEKA